MKTSVSKEELEMLHRWTKGDRDAMALLWMVGEAMEVADDLEDGDAKDTSEAMTALLTLSFTRIPTNPFFQRFAKEFGALSLTVSLAWDLSNRLQKTEFKEKKNSLSFAFHLRYYGEQFIYLTAYLVGGFDHARQVALEVFEFYHTNERNETLESWKGEL